MKRMYVCALGRLGVLIGCLAIIPAATVHAADKDAASLTTAELRARVAVLEQDLARVQQDYQFLLTTTCPSQPSSVARSADGSFERATAAAEQRAFEEANLRDAVQQQRRLEDASWYVKDVDFGVTERNRVFVRFGWKLTVKNGTPRRQMYDIEVQFLDSRGLVVSTDRLYRQVIAAQDEQTLHGEDLISVPAAFGVTQINAIATRRPENH